MGSSKPDLERYKRCGSVSNNLLIPLANDRCPTITQPGSASGTRRSEQSLQPWAVHRLLGTYCIQLSPQYRTPADS